MEALCSPTSGIGAMIDRKSTRLNSSHEWISYAVFCLKKKTTEWIVGCAAPRRHQRETTPHRAAADVAGPSGEVRDGVALLEVLGDLRARFLFFSDTATTEIYTLSLHDALPICSRCPSCTRAGCGCCGRSSSIRRSADRKSTRLNSSHEWISYAVFCLKKKNDGEPTVAGIAQQTHWSEHL